jgi:1,4-alpha-glucan branching enzyme
MMSACPVISLVLEAHHCFVQRGCSCAEILSGPEEFHFFESLSETYLPLLETLERLDSLHIPFRLGLVVSPVLCHLLTDKGLIKRYLEYTDKQIEFGRFELNRSSGDPARQKLIRLYYDKFVERRIAFTERYDRDILKVLDVYQRRGNLEIIASPATHAFLPFYAAYPEAIQAQIEAAAFCYRSRFGKYPQGFWLPELGWSEGLEKYIRAYNFGYTIVEAHGLVFGKPPASRGSFYPAKTPAGVFVLGRDYRALRELAARAGSGKEARVYRDNCSDAGYDLPAELVKPFLGTKGLRRGTGYKYRSREKGGVYDPLAAQAQAQAAARGFLESCISRLTAASRLMEVPPLCLCSFDADFFGRDWYEGPLFIEALFREAAGREDIRFKSPAEYLFKQDAANFQTLSPEFSSQGTNGYAETWLDGSNDWMYRHAFRALERMIELAERFPDDTGLKERALNQAAREILLMQSSDWPRMLYQEKSSEYARCCIEDSLRNFTTIYEALGSNYISTQWLTGLEKRHNIFPHINYRVFRRKK